MTTPEKDALLADVLLQLEDAIKELDHVEHFTEVVKCLLILNELVTRVSMSLQTKGDNKNAD